MHSDYVCSLCVSIHITLNYLLFNYFYHYSLHYFNYRGCVYLIKRTLVLLK